MIIVLLINLNIIYHSETIKNVIVIKKQIEKEVIK